MPEISIEQSTYKRLASLARTFETEDMVINRALGALENQQKPPKPVEPKGGVSDQVIVIDPNSISEWDLTHTKILEATIAEERIYNPNWNELLGQLLILVVNDVRNVERLRQISSLSFEIGHRKERGYKYLPKINVSYYGLAANTACRKFITVAQKFGICADITFMWRNKEKAMFPGEKARLLIVTGAIQ